MAASTSPTTKARCSPRRRQRQAALALRRRRRCPRHRDRDRPHRLHLRFKTGHTIGLDAVTHKETFDLKQAGYTLVVSDSTRLYLVGYYVLVGLEPTGR